MQGNASDRTVRNTAGQRRKNATSASECGALHMGVEGTTGYFRTRDWQWKDLYRNLRHTRLAQAPRAAYRRCAERIAPGAMARGIDGTPRRLTARDFAL